MKCNEKEKDNVCYAQPKTIEQRVAIANDFTQRFKFTVPFGIDEMNNAANDAYAAWPERLYIIDEQGRIPTKAAMGPFNYEPKEVRRWLARRYGEVKHPEPAPVTAAPANQFTAPEHSPAAPADQTQQRRAIKKTKLLASPVKPPNRLRSSPSGNPGKQVGLGQSSVQARILLAIAGVCADSRGKSTAERKTCTTNPEAPVRMGLDRIEVEGQKIEAAAKIYLMMNKPRGIVTTAADEKGRDTVYSLLPADWNGSRRSGGWTKPAKACCC